MNKVILVGNLAADPQMRHTQSGTPICQFRLAVRRRRQTEDKQADFFNIAAWRGTGEVVAKYARKGDRLGVVGILQERSYTDSQGEVRYVTEVVAESVELLGGKRDEGMALRQEEFVQVSDDELPF